MDESTYIKDRVEDQINWYSKKSTFNKNRYMLFRTIVIVLSVSIPFATGYIEEGRIGDIIKIGIGCAGIIIAALEGVQALRKYQEHWVQYRTSAEQLTREKILFNTKAGIYATSTQPFKDFVTNTENILGNENKQWVEFAMRNEGDSSAT